MPPEVPSGHSRSSFGRIKKYIFLVKMIFLFNRHVFLWPRTHANGTNNWIDNGIVSGEG